MKLERLSPAMLQFLSGVAAAVAVNLITTIAAASASQWWRFFLEACPWAIISVSLFWVGSNIEHARRDADLLITRNLSWNERGEIYRNAVEPFRRQARLCLLSVIVLAIIGAVLFPVLF